MEKKMMGEGGRRNWQKRGGVEVRCKRTMALLRHSESHYRHFNTPPVRLINDSVQCRLQRARSAQVIFLLECPFTLWGE